MNSNVAIKVEQLSKAYTIWSSPAARLHGPVLGRIGQLPFVPLRARRLCQRLSHESFKNFYALKNVSFQIRKGDSVGIIGRNGSGKSTLLQILAGTLTPTEGEVAVNGSIAALLELGSGFNPEFTGRENVFMNAAIRGLSRKETEDKFDTIARFADIGDFIDQPIKTYSSGMIVRLAFAISACVQPEVLIVDEALSVGDIFFQQKCARHMKEKMQGVTKILVTHDLQAVCNLTDFVYVLNGGQIVFAGPPKAAVEYYVKLAQNEEFGLPLGNEPPPASPQRPLQFDNVPWIQVKTDTQAGRGEVQIASVAVTDPAGVPLQAVQPKTRVVVHMMLTCAVAKNNIILGYIVNDRLGNAICGDNTCGVPGGIFFLASGKHVARYEFEWPEIRSGEYTMTVGAGEGTDSLDHVIQCWAHNIVKFIAVSSPKVGHCIFNNPLYNLTINTM